MAVKTDTHTHTHTHRRERERERERVEEEGRGGREGEGEGGGRRDGQTERDPRHDISMACKFGELLGGHCYFLSFADSFLVEAVSRDTCNARRGSCDFMMNLPLRLAAVCCTLQ